MVDNAPESSGRALVFKADTRFVVFKNLGRSASKFSAFGVASSGRYDAYPPINTLCSTSFFV